MKDRLDVLLYKAFQTAAELGSGFGVGLFILVCIFGGISLFQYGGLAILWVIRKVLEIISG